VHEEAVFYFMMAPESKDLVELVMFVGLQASGKTTFYARRFADTHVLVSKDRMRSARSKSRRQAREIETALLAGRSVVVDNTNPGAAEREEALAIARRLGVRAVAYWFDSPLDACLARNEAREGLARVPKVALFATAARLAPPSPAEGFAEVFRVRIAEDGFEVEPFRPPEPGGAQSDGGDH
jgi:hypothetical protein